MLILFFTASAIFCYIYVRFRLVYLKNKTNIKKNRGDKKLRLGRDSIKIALFIGSINHSLPPSRPNKNGDAEGLKNIPSRPVMCPDK
jgi:hypothetical protein